MLPNGNPLVGVQTLERAQLVSASSNGTMIESVNAETKPLLVGAKVNAGT
jgi:hypothetical protein